MFLIFIWLTLRLFFFVFSVDFRFDGLGLKSKIFTVVKRFKNRIKLYTNKNTKDKNIILERVEIADEGVYKCRVDYENSPTVTKILKLKVVGK